MSSRALFPDPDNAELGLILIVLDMKSCARSNRAGHSPQHGSPITDVSDLGVLRERQRFGVDAPDAHGQECGDPSIATTIHASDGRA